MNEKEVKDLLEFISDEANKELRDKLEKNGYVTLDEIMLPVYEKLGLASIYIPGRYKNIGWLDMGILKNED